MAINSAELHYVRPNALRVKHVMERMFRGYPASVGVRVGDGETITLGPDRPIATIVVKYPKPLRDLTLLRDPLRLAEAYVHGEIDVEGDLYALLAQRTHLHLSAPALSPRDQFALFCAALLLGRNAPYARNNSTSERNNTASVVRPQLQGAFLAGQSKMINRDTVPFQYAASNAFYQLWLDEQMVCSSAYFTDPAETLSQAQRNALGNICRKLQLKQGDRLLDIGCGWGALLFWAAQHYGVRTYGMASNPKQYEYVQNKIRNLGLEGQVTVKLQNYHDLPPAAVFDKVASVGMFEHVGVKNLPAYFQTICCVLKPGGLFLHHGITQDEEAETECKTTAADFMQCYVLPQGELDCVNNVQRAIEQTGCKILEVEGLRSHYALTLKHWVNKLEASRQESLAHVSEATYRVWRLYMAACASQFEHGSVGVHQIVGTKVLNKGVSDPSTRH